jgi:hypothetical protein
MGMETMAASKTLSKHSSSSSALFVHLITLTFLVLGLISILHHEMWRDELQAWLLAKDSASIAELIHNMRYEGHPALWHICLFLISRVTHNPVSMQLLHLGIGTAVIYTFLRFSPFSRLQKFLFTFSYFPFYEYTIISRNYSIGILFIFLLCALYDRCRNYIPFAILIALLANTNAFGFLIAASFVATLIVEKVLTGKQSKFSNNLLVILASGLIVSAGFAVSLLQVVSRIEDAGQASSATATTGEAPDLILGGNNIARLAIGFIILLKSYIPIPDISNYQFWNTSLFTSTENLYIKAFSLLLAFGLLFLSIALLARQPIPLFLYSLGTFSIVFFSYDKFTRQPRHYGHIFILFIACLWLAAYYQEIRFSFLDRFFYPILRPLHQRQKHLLVALLCTQVIANVFAVGMDLIYPFSASQEVANFIRKQGLENALIVGSSDAPTASVAGYLNRRIYYPESDRLGSFILWQGRERVRPSVMLSKVSQLLNGNQKEALLVLSYELKANHPDLTIGRLFDSQRSIALNETYHLYTVTKNSQEP